MLAIVLLLFIGIPLVEIYVLIEVGNAIGALTTVFAVVFTAVLGVTLIRIQGFSTLQKAQIIMNQGGVPALEMFEGIMLLFAAICLLIPGFFTDTLGFLLLIPPLRHFLAAQLIGNSVFKSRFHQQQGDYLEGEYENITPEQQHLRNQDHSERQTGNIIEGQLDENKN
ncbi:MAG: FxsA family protein [gamma proteobacterium symbiont of Taylorina sp.]|nr:FxsA family protein [gamma proteobacterium symbiont of Taylorina sp.]